MTAALFLTLIYQILLNIVFSLLFLSLPVTLEDEAVLRDEAFRRAQEVSSRDPAELLGHRGRNS
jgi:calcium permeable stress-gated cation channel